MSTTPSSSISRQLLSLAVPIIGINVLNVMMLAVDSALCGRLPNGEDTLEALAVATQIVFVLMVAMLGLTVGTVSLVARAYGGRAFERVNDLLVQSTQLTVVIGVVVGIAGAVFAEPLMSLLGAEPEIAAIGADYLRVLMLGTPFVFLSILYAGIFRGVGNTRIPFLCALLANVINLILNYGLVLGNLGMPQLGVVGSAIGTNVAQLVSAVAMIRVLRGGRINGLKLPLRPRRVDRALAIDLFRVGGPAAADMLIINVGFLAVVIMLHSFGNAVVGAHGLGLRVQALTFVPGLGVAQAAAALVGQALGASDPERARRVARAAMRLCFVIMTAIAVAVFFAAHPLAQLFAAKPGTPLEEYTVEWMRLLGYAMLPAAINIALVGVLQGSGATRTSLRINFWSTLCIQIPVAWLLGFPLGLGAWGVWFSFPIAFVARVAASYTVYRRGRWAVTGIGAAPKR